MPRCHPPRSAAYATVDLPGQVKLKSSKYRFQGKRFTSVTSPLFERPLIFPPSCLSRQCGSIHILYDPERSLGYFDLGSRQVKVTG